MIIFIIFIVGVLSLYMGYRLGFIEGFERMNKHAQLQVGMFASYILKDGRYTEHELKELSNKSQDEYFSLVEKYKNDNKQ